MSIAKERMFKEESVDYKLFSIISEVNTLIDNIELSPAIKENLKYIKKELEISYNAYKKQI
jgi:hypothetical protein